MAVRVTLEGQALALVEYLAAVGGCSPGEVVMNAICHEEWLTSEHAAGSRIFSVDGNGRRTSELILDD